MKKTGFTLFEIVLVLIIVGILLSIVFSLSFDYVNTMRVKTDKEQMANVITDAMALARTSNYFDRKRYDNMEINLIQESVSSSAVGGVFTGTQLIDSFRLLHSEIIFGTGITLTQLEIIPYDIGCQGLLNGVAVTGSVSFELHSLINSDIYCYEVEEDVCKLNQKVCPE